MFNCRQRVLFSLCFIPLPQDIPLIHRAEKFHCSTDQNPKSFVDFFLYMILNKLEPTFLMLLGQ